MERTTEKYAINILGAWLALIGIVYAIVGDFGLAAAIVTTPLAIGGLSWGLRALWGDFSDWYWSNTRSITSPKEMWKKAVRYAGCSYAERLGHGAQYLICSAVQTGVLAGLMCILLMLGYLGQINALAVLACACLVGILALLHLVMDCAMIEMQHEAES